MHQRFVFLGAVVLVTYALSAAAFPLYYNANGSAMLTSASGADVVLQPDAGGVVSATALFSAQAGFQLNGTLLNEAYLAGIAANVSDLAASLGAVSNVSSLVAEYASLAPIQLSGPPECGPPGGDRLQYVNGSWVCVCTLEWYGVSCDSLVPQLRGTASQSSTYYASDYPNQVAALANDNTTACDFPLGVGIAIADATLIPGGTTLNWWQLDLGTTRSVSYVTLYGRAGQYTDESSNLQVYVLTSPSIVGSAAALSSASQCGTGVVSAAYLDGVSVTCGSLLGRYVLVYQTAGQLGWHQHGTPPLQTAL